MTGGSTDAARRAAADGIARLRRTYPGAELPDGRLRRMTTNRRPGLLAALPAVTDADLAALHDRLAARRRRRGRARRGLPHAGHPGGLAAARGHPGRAGPGRLRQRGPRPGAGDARRAGQPADPERARAARRRRARDRRVLRRPAPRLRPAARLPAQRRIPAHGAQPPARHRLRAYRQLRNGRIRRGQPPGGPGRRHRVRDQSAAGRRALPPGHPLGWSTSAATGAARPPSGSCSTWRRRDHLERPGRLPRLAAASRPG